MAEGGRRARLAPDAEAIPPVDALPRARVLVPRRGTPAPLCDGDDSLPPACPTVPTSHRSFSMPPHPTGNAAASSSRATRSPAEVRPGRSRTVSPKPAAPQSADADALPPPRRHVKPKATQVFDDGMPPACYPKQAGTRAPTAAPLPAVPPARRLPTPTPLPVQTTPVPGRPQEAPSARVCLGWRLASLPTPDEWPAPRRPEEDEWPDPQPPLSLASRSISPFSNYAPRPLISPGPRVDSRTSPGSQGSSADRASLHSQILSAMGESPADVPDAIWQHIVDAVEMMSDDEIVYNWQHVLVQQTVMIEAGRKLKEIPAPADGATCSICLDPIHQSLRCFQLPCGHAFHGGCIMTWLHGQCRCPNCNYDLLRDTWGS